MNLADKIEMDARLSTAYAKNQYYISENTLLIEEVKNQLARITELQAENTRLQEQNEQLVFATELLVKELNAVKLDAQRELTTEQTEKIINDTCQMGFSIGGIKDPTWVVDHDKLEKYLLANTEKEVKQEITETNITP